MGKMKTQLILCLLIIAACRNKNTEYQAQLLPLAIDSVSASNEQLPPRADKIVVNSSQELTREAAACQLGITQAKTDRKRGIIGYYFGGAGIPSYADTLEQKYSMVIRRQGCVMEDGWECYNSYMDSVILAVYHVDIIAQEHSKAMNALLAKRRR